VIGLPRVTSRRPGLLARSRTSEQSFGEFYDAMAPAVLRFFARRTRDSERAFDLTAETFAKAFEKRRNFRGYTDEQAAAWLWSIARNELARYSRTRKVELAALARLGLERPDPSGAELRQIEELAAEEDIREHVDLALAVLPLDQREVVRLRFVDELSYIEIAQALGVSYDVVRARSSRALRTLRASEHLEAAVRVLET
jgi:RNA polymerase sigma factor (sigma-70 family)